jgi:hypothetical protein
MHYRLLFTPESEKKASMSALISSGLPMHIPRGPVHDTIFDDDHRFPNVTYVCHRIAIDQDDISELSGRNWAKLAVTLHDPRRTQRSQLRHSSGRNSCLRIQFKFALQGRSQPVSLFPLQTIVFANSRLMPVILPRDVYHAWLDPGVQ